MDNKISASGNNLFPLFLKLENFRLLIIGGGNVALEKLIAVLSNSPQTLIQLISLEISDEIRQLAEHYTTLTIVQKEYQPSDLDNADIIIAAVNNIETATRISKDARQKNKLINVADKPELCDFYLGSIVQKGSLKIAISTNGKSPTIAKRLKEFIADILPDELETVLEHIQQYRNTIKGDMAEKVKQLNALTKELVYKKKSTE